MTEAPTPIIDSVPGSTSNEEMLAGRRIPISEVRALVLQGSGVEVTPADSATAPASFTRVRRPSVAQETARQMGIDAADRANRQAAGLGPRTFDLR